MGLTSVMSGKEITAKTGFGDVSVRERLKLADFNGTGLRAFGSCRKAGFRLRRKSAVRIFTSYEIPGYMSPILPRLPAVAVETRVRRRSPDRQPSRFVGSV